MISETLLALIPLCAPEIAPNTVAQIMRVESNGNPLAINVNGINRKFSASSQKEAADIVRSYVSKGYSVDVGLMQVNSVNFSTLGYRLEAIESLFEPCNNIAAGGQILSNFYKRSQQVHSSGEKTLRGAISAYNTGSFTRGISNGYVDKVYKNQVFSMSNDGHSKLSEALNAPTSVNIDVLHGVTYESK